MSGRTKKVIFVLAGVALLAASPSSTMRADEERERVGEAARRQARERFLATPVQSRLKYHQAPKDTLPLMRDQHRYQLPSLLLSDQGQPLRSDQWYESRRPELVAAWTSILGKLSPTAEDRKWFGDIRNVVIHSREQRDGYERWHLSLPIEADFMQPHLLLVPTGQGQGPFPAVIAWTSTSPDYQEPERWWGAWLARRGYVVLTGWSFIRNYRGGTNYRDQVQDLVYQRFGHWLPMAKMVHDVQREYQYLCSRSDVDAQRVGFIGFSLSAKAALYVAAFAPEITATVAVDPHVALHGATNWHDRWYLDWRRKFRSIQTPHYPVPELRNTVWSLLDADPKRPGFERNHHELMALCAPRALMVIACSTDQYSATHSDDAQSWAYANRAREVYELVGMPDRFRFVATTVGHRATDPAFDGDWQSFFDRWLKREPITGNDAGT